MDLLPSKLLNENHNWGGDFALDTRWGFSKNWYYHLLVGHCGAFYGLKWRIWQDKCVLPRWNKPMKSEYHIIVPCKQPIKITRTWQCLLAFFLQRWWRKYPSDCFDIFLQFFIFSMSPKVIIIVYVLEHKYNYFEHFSQLILVRLAQNIFVPANINFTVLVRLFGRMRSI